MRYFLSILACLLISSCAPRGETRTLDEILDGSRQRYQEALAGGVEGDLNTQLTGLASRLEQLLSSDNSAGSGAIAEEVETSLRDLILHSSFTTRPAMGELTSQFALFSGDSNGGGDERKKLLVSRTYSMLARELETSRFRL